MTTESSEAQEVRRVLLLADLTGFARASSRLAAVDLARGLSALYRAWEAVIAGAGGRVVKFLGDACFAVFPADAGPRVVACAETLTAKLPGVGLPWEARVNVAIHVAVVAEGEFGVDGRFDVVGSGVNHVFAMARGTGIRISEPVYRQLPNDARGPWDKHKPAATYVRRR